MIKPKMQADYESMAIKSEEVIPIEKTIHEVYIELPHSRWDAIDEKINRIMSGEAIEQLLDSVVSVKQFGAIGDGIVDDTSFVQTTVDHVIANQMSEVYFPPGDYKVNTLNNLEEIIFIGSNVNFVGSIQYPISSISGVIERLIDLNNSVDDVVEKLILANQKINGITTKVTNLEESKSNIIGQLAGIDQNIDDIMLQLTNLSENDEDILTDIIEVIENSDIKNNEQDAKINTFESIQNDMKITINERINNVEITKNEMKLELISRIDAIELALKNTPPTSSENNLKQFYSTNRLKYGDAENDISNYWQGESSSIVSGGVTNSDKVFKLDANHGQITQTFSADGVQTTDYKLTGFYLPEAEVSDTDPIRAVVKVNVYYADGSQETVIVPARGDSNDA